MTIRGKAVAVTAAAGAVLCYLVAAMALATGRLQRQVTQLARQARVVDCAAALQDVLSDMARTEKQFLMTGRREWSDRLARQQDQIRNLVADMRRAADGDAIQGRVEEVGRAAASHEASLAKAVEWRRAGRVEAARALSTGPLWELTGKLDEALERVVRETRTSMGSVHQRSADLYQGAQRVLWGVVAGLGVLVFVSLGFLIRLAASLGRLAAAMERLAEARFDQELPGPPSGDEVGRVVTVFNGMVRSLRALTEHLEHEATTDGLTQLATRRVFDRRLREEVARARRYRRPLSLVLFDLDHFKAYNDTFGHRAGDQALEACAAELRRAVRSADVAARYGGEELAVILPESTRAQAEDLAERVVKSVSGLNDGRPPITASAGVAAMDDLPAEGPADWDALFKAADQALYRAKAAGRNRVQSVDSPGGVG